MLYQPPNPHLSPPLDSADTEEDIEGGEQEEASGFEEPISLPTVAMRPDYKAQDSHLFNQWNTTKSKEDLSKLLKHLSPIINSEVNRSAGTLPKSALAGMAKIYAVKAIKSYDPSKGAALSTHVVSRIQKIRRLNAKYANNARLPEDQYYEFRHYKKHLTNLNDELNREPTPEELAKSMGWSKGKVIKFKSRLYDDLIESVAERSSQMTEHSDRTILMSHLLDRLTPDERLIVESKGTIPAPELAKKLGVNTNRLNYMQRKLVDKIKGIQKEIGL